MLTTASGSGKRVEHGHSEPLNVSFGHLVGRLAEIVALPFVYWIRWSNPESTRNDRFQTCSEFLAVIPGQLGIVSRNAFYKRTFASCGSRFVCRSGTIFLNPDSEIGANTLIGRSCTIGLVSIGNNVLLAHGVSLLSGRHQHGGKSQAELPPSNDAITRIIIGNDVWIGASATVMNDVGDNAIVGAGSVVVHAIPANAIAVGNPARVVGDSGAGR